MVLYNLQKYNKRLVLKIQEIPGIYIPLEKDLTEQMLNILVLLGVYKGLEMKFNRLKSV